MPVRAACVLFGLEKSQFSTIFLQMIKIFYETYIGIINIENRTKGNELCLKEFPHTYTIVDSTECHIESNNRDEFSGKKGVHTLKYQTIVGSVTGEILGIHGPETGPTADCKIFETSGLGQFLDDNDEWRLADKGYVGCRNVIHP